jgi:hypothetical protein
VCVASSLTEWFIDKYGGKVIALLNNRKGHVSQQSNSFNQFLVDHRYLSTALSVLLMIVKKFGHIIHTTCASLPALDIDFEAEERYEIIRFVACL